MHEPFVHEMEDGRIHILILPDDGKWELNVVDLRTPFDRAPQLAGFAQPEDALARGHDYVREVDPEYDCEAGGATSGWRVHPSRSRGRRLKPWPRQT